MEKSKTVDSYINNHPNWSEELTILRKLVLKTELEETVKWGMPVYTLGGKNVVGVTGFKHHFGLWFYQGVFLSDPAKLLRNAQAGKTKAMRHLNFTSKKEIDVKVVKAYLAEAIQNQKDGKMVKATPRKLEMPELLKKALAEDKALMSAFQKFTPGNQKDFMEHIHAAKMEKTKVSRLAKILPMIERGEGLSDKYKKK